MPLGAPVFPAPCFRSGPEHGRHEGVVSTAGVWVWGEGPLCCWNTPSGHPWSPPHPTLPPPLVLLNPDHQVQTGPPGVEQGVQRGWLKVTSSRSCRGLGHPRAPACPCLPPGAPMGPGPVLCGVGEIRVRRQGAVPSTGARQLLRLHQLSAAAKDLGQGRTGNRGNLQGMGCTEDGGDPQGNPDHWIALGLVRGQSPAPPPQPRLHPLLLRPLPRGSRPCCPPQGPHPSDPAP